MRIDQRNYGAAQTFTAAGTVAYCVDRFYGNCTGANVTGQRVAGSGADQYLYQFTGAASVTGIVFGQRIEATNIIDLVSTTATFSVELANSLLTAVTWTAYYPTVTDNYTSKTQIATGTFTVNSTLSRYSANIALGANIGAGLAIELSVGAQTSGTWKIGEFQLETGTSATSFERRPVGFEFGLCQRYLYVLPNASYIAGQCISTGSAFIPVNFPVSQRILPTSITLGNAANSYSCTDATGAVHYGTSLTFISATVENSLLSFGGASGLVGGNATMLYTGGYIRFEGAEL
jgi:hypothetical protein